MAEDPQLRANRLALLAQLQALCSPESRTCRGCPVERAGAYLGRAATQPVGAVAGLGVLHRLPLRVDVPLRDPVRARVRWCCPSRAALRWCASTAARCSACCGGAAGSPTASRAQRLPAGNHMALWKHSSSWETMAMMVVFPRQVWVLKRELVWIPVVGLGLRQLHAIAIDRKAGHSAVVAGARAGQAAPRRRRLDHYLSRRHAHAAGRDPPLRRERRRCSPRRPGGSSCRWRTTPATTGRGAA